jgi:predicted MFS family arabinose efflux permease
VGLFFFYITFEFTLVSTLPVMTEILPGARATLLAAGIGAFSLGRAIGAALAAPLYAWGFWANSGASVLFNLLALLALLQLARALQVKPPAA